MLKSIRQNYHHSKLPKLGEIVTIPIGKYSGCKAIVTAFNLCDNCLPYSVGIHLVHVELLKDKSQLTIAGNFFVE